MRMEGMENENIAINGGYSEKTDEELCRMAKDGDTAASDALIRRYFRIVKKIARRYFFSGADEEDLIQEGMFGLIKAQRDYSDKQNVSFSAYAQLCIRTYIFTAIRNANRKKHSPLNNYVSLAESESEKHTQLDFRSSCLSDPEVILLDKEDALEFEQTAKDVLSVFETQVFGLYLNGFSLNEIAVKLGVGYKSVDNAVSRAKRKLSLRYNPKGGSRA